MRFLGFLNFFFLGTLVVDPSNGVLDRKDDDDDDLFLQFVVTFR